MKKILVFMSNGFEILEFSPFIDVFGWNNLMKKKMINPVVIGFGKTITSAWGVKINPEINLLENKLNLSEYEALVIPGGFGSYGFFSDIQKDEFNFLLKYFIDSEKIVVGICTGALAIGINGYLKGKKATTYRLENGRYFKQLEKYGAIPVDIDIVIEKNIITSSGPSSAIEIAFHLLERLTSKENVEEVKRNMQY